MARTKDALLQDLSTADLKRLLAARERIDVLEKEKAGLVTALARIDGELDKLIAAAMAATGAGTGGGKTNTKKAGTKKAGRKKTARKKATRRKTATKKAAGKKKSAQKATAKKTTRKKATRKKATGKKVARKAVAKKSARKTTSRAGGGARRETLEAVIVKVLTKAGGQMAYKDLFARIVDGKLFKTTSSNFDNVMRRTLSTSEKVERVGRGIYGLA